MKGSDIVKVVRQIKDKDAIASNLRVHLWHYWATRWLSWEERSHPLGAQEALWALDCCRALRWRRLSSRL